MEEPHEGVWRLYPADHISFPDEDPLAILAHFPREVLKHADLQ